jgi:hypothetical protein
MALALSSQALMGAGAEEFVCRWMEVPTGGVILTNKTEGGVEAARQYAIAVDQSILYPFLLHGNACSACCVLCAYRDV